jgi:hypothetical protein
MSYAHCYIVDFQVQTKLMRNDNSRVYSTAKMILNPDLDLTTILVLVGIGMLCWLQINYRRRKGLNLPPGSSILLLK